MTNINSVKGFNDFTGEEAQKRAEIKKILVNTFERYGFEPVETPVVEYEEFIKDSQNGTNQAIDEVISDIFKLKDKGKRNLALRYEFTFQLKRLMINKKLPFKRYQIGEVFRDEPVSSARYRQFIQADTDIIGSTIKDEAEILFLVKEILDKLNIKFSININNRKLLNEILNNQGINNKEQVIKEIDKLDKIPEKQVEENLKKYNAGEILKILKKPEAFFKKYQAYSEIAELKKYCNIYGLKNCVKFQPNLARGLSYYDGTIFEIKTKKIKETICAGGSFTFNNVKSTGISFGLDRLSVLAEIKTEKEKFLIISLNQDKESIKLVQKLRKQEKIVSLFYGKPSKALEYANSYNIEKVIFVGKEEIKKKKFKIKDMKTGKESFNNF